MEVAMPIANSGTAAAMDSYEDMFKEITRKLYGEDGLPDIIAGEKLTNIQTASSEKGLSSIDYEVDSPVFKPDEHITAFGLAALMQNGFSSGGMLNPSFQQVNKQSTTAEDKWITNDDNLQWTQSKIASYNPSQKLFKCTDCECVGFLMRVAEHWLGTHANLRVFQCPQCPYASAWARCVRMHIARQHNINAEETVNTLLKENPVMHEITRYLQTLKTKYETNSAKVLTGNQSTVADTLPQNNKTQMNSPQRINTTSPSVQTITDNTGGGSTSITNKRYSCSYCPYATDRRDLFTRHENIHREEKPFQCYVCQKQFNRADHVKKHFLRMHREHPYDLNRIRRQPPKNASGMSYYQKYNSNDTSISTLIESTSNTQHIIQHQLTIPNGFSTMNRTGQNVPVTKIPNNQNTKSTSMKLNSSSKTNCKKKGDKRYSCCYCSWSGVDNWCLKRHLNTHLKPFVCGLCDYKAARSERLATHVLKVHNKRACGRCLYLADDQAQLTLHQQEHHSLEQRNNKSSNNILRSTYSGIQNSTTETFSQTLGSVTPTLKTYDISAAILQHGSRLLPVTGNFLSNTNSKPWKSYTPKQHGAARLFNYMEASDGSDPECDANIPNEDMNRISSTTSRNHSDFLEAGDVGIQNIGEQEELEEDMELPLFMCRECGCEFIDDISLDTHILTHHQAEKIPTSPENKQIMKNNDSYRKNATKTNNIASNKSSLGSKENLNPKSNYICMVCKLNFGNQINIMNHMKSHVNLSYKKRELSGKKHMTNKKNNEFCDESHIANFYQNANSTFKRSRKQSQPRKVVSPFYESQEIQIMKGTNLKNRQWKSAYENCGNDILKLKENYMSKLITRKRFSCNLCKKGNSLFPYHTKNSLAVHHMFKHVNIKKFECEHCSMTFRHRYQIVLHASRKHIHNLSILQNSTQQISIESELDKQIVPKINKETMPCNVIVPVLNNVQNTDSLIITNVPDNSTSNISVDKLHMHSFLEQSMINPNNSINNNMPITIPTFPPS